MVVSTKPIAERLVPMTDALDARDDALLTLLRDDARRSVAELARRVHLSPNAVRHRLARLERTGRIGGYTLRQVAPGAEALLLVTHMPGRSCEDLRAEIAGLTAVRRLVSVAGGVDSAVWLAAPTADGVAKAARTIGALACVARCETHLALDVLIDR